MSATPPNSNNGGGFWLYFLLMLAVFAVFVMAGARDAQRDRRRLAPTPAASATTEGTRR